MIWEEYQEKCQGKGRRTDQGVDQAKTQPVQILAGPGPQHTEAGSTPGADRIALP